MCQIPDQPLLLHRSCTKHSYSSHRCSSIQGRGARVAARPWLVGCANYDIRASRAQMMMINKGMNGVSIRIRCARIGSLSRASRTAVGPVPSFAVWRVRCRDRGASQRERMLCERLRVGAGAYLCQNPTSHFLGYTSLFRTSSSSSVSRRPVGPFVGRPLAGVRDRTIGIGDSA